MLGFLETFSNVVVIDEDDRQTTSVKYVLYATMVLPCLLDPSAHRTIS